MVADLDPAERDPVEVGLVSGDIRLTGRFDPGSRTVELLVASGGATTSHRSRRHGRTGDGEVTRLALTLTGTHLTAWTRENRTWAARARHDLAGRVETRDETWVHALRAGHAGVVTRLRAGGFGQLGLRDLRLVTDADGSAHRTDGRILLSATSAGPGFFDTAHTSVWALDRATLELEHLSDLFVRRPVAPAGAAGVVGDHASHLVRDGDGWLLATSTWGCFSAWSQL